MEKWEKYMENDTKTDHFLFLIPLLFDDVADDVAPLFDVFFSFFAFNARFRQSVVQYQSPTGAVTIPMHLKWNHWYLHEGFSQHTISSCFSWKIAGIFEFFGGKWIFIGKIGRNDIFGVKKIVSKLFWNVLEQFSWSFLYKFRRFSLVFASFQVQDSSQPESLLVSNSTKASQSHFWNFGTLRNQNFSNLLF